ncbi:MAG: 2'-deoxycytidine 5'-triphosphate deaminase [Candidatus Aminicenantes bacterium]|nr:MAG: 2'-deoxycytidine 5'-triphosphate deaminase [Candidatus Aminicenantes bacterium]
MAVNEWDNWRPGVLNKDQIKALDCSGKLERFNMEALDHSAIDLHISDIGHKMRGSVKPLNDVDISNSILSFREKDDDFKRDGKFYLKKAKTYIFQLEESLNLKGTKISAQATGKSTYGRLDILTRLLTNFSVSFDTIASDYKGSLWVEVTPITFPVIIEPGISLNQLRLLKGEPRNCRIKEEELHLWGDLILNTNDSKEEGQNNLTLSLDEDPVLKNGICAFKAKEIDDNDESNFIDLTKDFSKEENKYDPKIYWESESVSSKEKYLPIETERFYILRSIERFKLPKSVAIYCQAVTETLGELRIHYAGFVHPLFGQGRADDFGAPLIFEVRGHNIDTILRHGETLAKLEYYWMSQDAGEEQKDSPYNNQELTLSKIFKKWEE